MPAARTGTMTRWASLTLSLSRGHKAEAHWPWGCLYLLLQAIVLPDVVGNALVPEPSNGKVPTSTVTKYDNGPNPHAETLRFYYELTHVVLRNITIHAYLPASASAEELRGFSALLTPLASAGNSAVEVVMHRLDDSGADPRRCDTKFFDPTLIYGTPAINKLHPFMMDNWAAVFPTLDAFGLLQNFPSDVKVWEGKLDLCDFQTRLLDNAVILLTWKGSDHRRWGFSMHMLANRWAYIQPDRSICCNRLILGRKSTLNYFAEINDTTARAKELQKLAWFLRHAAALHQLQHDQEQAQHKPLPVEQIACDVPLPEGEYQQQGKPLVVLLIQRGRNVPRPIVNHEKLRAHIAEDYDVQVESVVVEGMAPWSSVELMGRSSVVMGMHGAALWHTIFLRPGASAIQLVPYGWGGKEGQRRVQAFRNLIADVGANYFEWANPNASAAFIWPYNNKADRKQLDVSEGIPTDELPTEWRQQASQVQMRHFAPILAQAMAAAGISPKLGSGAARLWSRLQLIVVDRSNTGLNTTAAAAAERDPALLPSYRDSDTQVPDIGTRSEVSNATRISTVQKFDNGRLADHPQYHFVRYFYDARNAVLKGNTVYLYMDPADQPELMSFEKPLTYFRGHKMPDLQVEVVRWEPAAPDPFSSCRQWVHDPAMFYGDPYGNLWHYLLDAWGAVFPTLQGFGLLDNFNKPEPDYSKLDVCGFQQRLQATRAVLLTWPELEHPHWGFSMEVLAKQRQLITKETSICFDRLIIGKRLELDYFFNHLKPAVRSQHMRRAAWFLRHASALQQLRRQQGNDTAFTQLDCRQQLPAFRLHGDAEGLALVVFLARGDITAPRAVLNLNDITQYLQSKYKVHVEVVNAGDLAPWEIADLMWHADCVLGMHGAAWTNTLFLRPNTSALQMLPAGPLTWSSRALYFAPMLEDLGVHYFEWQNPDLELAYQWVGDTNPDNATGQSLLGKTETKGMTPADTAIWRQQQTFVGMDSIAPVLHEALAAVGVAKRTTDFGDS